MTRTSRERAGDGAARGDTSRPEIPMSVRPATHTGECVHLFDVVTQGGGGGWHDAGLCCCLQRAAPIGLSPLTTARPLNSAHECWASIPLPAPAALTF